MKQRSLLKIVIAMFVVCLCSVLDCNVVKAEKYGDYEYEVINADKVEITGYSGSKAEFVIPDTIDGKKVTSIGDYAFGSCTSVSSITIPNGVTKIGEYAFGYTQLTSITIPESVTSIGENAFEGCYKLESITIPEGVTSIGYRTFYGCSRLKNITIPESVTNSNR